MYEATISHHTISRARRIRARSLAAIKRKAIAEFSDELRDYKIIVYDLSGPDAPLQVASRRVGDRRWDDDSR